jgi:hypothetical protein
MTGFTYPRFLSIERLKSEVTHGGSHFFDRDAMRFFKSRVNRTLYGGRFFVTSEDNGYDGRKYTVRFVRQDANGHYTMTDTGFQRYSTSRAANNAARALGQRFYGTDDPEEIVTVDSDREYL